jgi:hypothetical protein
MQSPPFPRYLVLLGPNILLNTMFSNTLSFLSSRNFGDQVSHPYKTIGKIIVLCISIFKFLDGSLLTWYYTKIPYIIHNSHKTILLQIASKLTARYIDNFYKAVQNIQIPTTPSTICGFYLILFVFYIFYLILY